MRLLDSFLEQLLTEKSFDPDYPLFRQTRGDQTILTIPEGATKKSHFLKWIDNLPSVESPIWLGLPENAEVLLLTKKGQAVFRKLLKLQVKNTIPLKLIIQTIEEDTGDSADNKEDTKGEDRRPAWMTTLKASIEGWLKGLPEVFLFDSFI